MSQPANKNPRAEKECTSSKTDVGTTVSTKDHNLQEAAERVYRQYGSDLSAFYRNARRERELEKRG